MKGPCYNFDGTELRALRFGVGWSQEGLALAVNEYFKENGIKRKTKKGTLPRTTNKGTISNYEKHSFPRNRVLVDAIIAVLVVGLLEMEGGNLDDEEEINNKTKIIRERLKICPYIPKPEESNNSSADFTNTKNHYQELKEKDKETSRAGILTQPAEEVKLQFDSHIEDSVNALNSIAGQDQYAAIKKELYEPLDEGMKSFAYVEMLNALLKSGNISEEDAKNSGEGLKKVLDIVGFKNKLQLLLAIGKHDEAVAVMNEAIGETKSELAYHYNNLGQRSNVEAISRNLMQIQANIAAREMTDNVKAEVDKLIADKNAYGIAAAEIYKTNKFYQETTRGKSVISAIETYKGQILEEYIGVINKGLEQAFEKTKAKFEESKEFKEASDEERKATLAAVKKQIVVEGLKDILKELELNENYNEDKDLVKSFKQYKALKSTEDTTEILQEYVNQKRLSSNEVNNTFLRNNSKRIKNEMLEVYAQVATSRLLKEDGSIDKEKLGKAFDTVDSYKAMSTIAALKYDMLRSDCPRCEEITPWVKVDNHKYRCVSCGFTIYV